jgi:hypothetical protein
MIMEGTIPSLCLISDEEQKLDALSTRALDALIDEVRAFAEPKEPLGGFILIAARDMDDAMPGASTIPPARDPRAARSRRDVGDPTGRALFRLRRAMGRIKF